MHTHNTVDTPTPPQWAIDAADEMRHLLYDNGLKSLDECAAIIAKHAPKSLSRHTFADGGAIHDGTMLLKEMGNVRMDLAEARTTIAENARLREALQRIRQLLKSGRIPDAMLVCVTSGSDGPFITEQV